MDQKQTGKFIAEMRRERNLTQKELADRLCISDKTVSKWECGGGFPEVGLILSLCDELGVTANELLSGKRLTDTEYKKNAEENIVRLMAEKKDIKRKIILVSIVVLVTIIIAVTFGMIASYVDMSAGWRIALIVSSLVVIAIGVTIAIVLERKVLAYQCSVCKERFEPTLAAYIFGMHTFHKRYLKCPKCGVRNWCKHCTKENLQKSEKE
ncbi:MAG: helix-turn-helix transcriptional regulator [Clostridia bacterium]|nr:helix-turn-helix transcriptional regulator [Clostridia bacterium]